MHTFLILCVCSLAFLQVTYAFSYHSHGRLALQKSQTEKTNGLKYTALRMSNKPEEGGDEVSDESSPKSNSGSGGKPSSPSWVSLVGNKDASLRTGRLATDLERTLSRISSVDEATAVKEEPLPLPRLITFDGIGTILRLSAPIGFILRAVIHKHFGYTARLPRPDIFRDAYIEAFMARSKELPCYGCGAGVSSVEWWSQVIEDTYMVLVDSYGCSYEELMAVLPGAFEDLYFEVLTGPDGWEIREEAQVFLDEFQALRAQGLLKLGIVANYDERMEKILENLEIDHYFDFVITSRELGCEKPNRQLFDVALTKSGQIKNPAQCLHIGVSKKQDVDGALEAGWQAAVLSRTAMSPLFKMMNGEDLGQTPDEIFRESAARAAQSGKFPVDRSGKGTGVTVTTSSKSDEKKSTANIQSEGQAQALMGPAGGSVKYANPKGLLDRNTGEHHFRGSRLLAPGGKYYELGGLSDLFYLYGMEDRMPKTFRSDFVTFFDSAEYLEEDIDY